jgi:hypothetical protein
VFLEPNDVASGSAMNLANTETYGELENHIFSTVTSLIAQSRKEEAAELVET